MEGKEEIHWSKLGLSFYKALHPISREDQLASSTISLRSVQCVNGFRTSMNNDCSHTAVGFTLLVREH